MSIFLNEGDGQCCIARAGKCMHPLVFHRSKDKQDLILFRVRSQLLILTVILVEKVTGSVSQGRRASYWPTGGLVDQQQMK